MKFIMTSLCVVTFYLDMSHRTFTNQGMKKESKHEGQFNELIYTARLIHDGKSEGVGVSSPCFMGL